MVRVMNIVSVMGIMLLIMPLLWVASDAWVVEQIPLDKAIAFKALFLSLSGLGIAVFGVTYVILVRRIERLRE
jgi:hypothetical protein